MSSPFFFFSPLNLVPSAFPFFAVDIYEETKSPGNEVAVFWVPFVESG